MGITSIFNRLWTRWELELKRSINCTKTAMKVLWKWIYSQASGGCTTQTPALCFWKPPFQFFRSATDVVAIRLTTRHSLVIVHWVGQLQLPWAIKATNSIATSVTSSIIINHLSYQRNMQLMPRHAMSNYMWTNSSWRLTPQCPAFV